MSPYFSIILPTYNRESRIIKTIDSILNQVFSDWELIIVDDGSTDNSGSIITALSDKRIKYFHKENGERGAARNYGVKMATGKYINFFDSDDLMHPWHLSEAFQHLNNNDSVNCLSFSYDYYTFDGKYINTKKWFKPVLNDDVKKFSFVHLNSSFILRDLCIEFPFKEDRNFHISEDWYFFLQLSFYQTLHGVNKPTTMYVLHPNSSMSNMKPDEFITATVYFEDLLVRHNAEKQLFSNIYAELFSMTSLAYALEGKRGKSLRYIFKSMAHKPGMILKRRFYAILKNIIYVKRRG